MFSSCACYVKLGYVVYVVSICMYGFTVRMVCMRLCIHAMLCYVMSVFMHVRMCVYVI